MMPMGTSLSRWTMSYFAAALLFLLFAEGLLATGSRVPSLDIAEPRALIIVHSTTIGWLGLLMIGALLQFGPVVTGLSLPTGNLGLTVLGGVVFGLGLLLCGFRLIENGSVMAGPVMVTAASVLVISILSIASVLFALLWRGRNAHEASRFLLIGICSLAATVALGALFALVISGTVGIPSVVSFVVDAAPLHAGLGLGGWMTFGAIGVTYKLLPMFLLSNDMKRSVLLYSGGWAVVGLLVCAAIALVFDANVAAGTLALLAPFFLLIATAAYLAELFRTYRGRRRKTLELNTFWSLPAFVLLGASVPLLAFALVFHAGQHAIIALSYLFVFGWLSGLGLAQLLKIVPFLTWIEAFGPLLGRRPTPRLADLVAAGRSSIWLGAFYVAVVCAAAAIFLQWDDAFRMAAFVQALSTAALAVELALSRGLVGVDAEAKQFPFKHPSFFFAGNNRGNANGSAS
ncbi:hypothetical protein QD357_28945 [Rhizobium sp. BR 317]